jgi:hypothetical protein
VTPVLKPRLCLVDFNRASRSLGCWPAAIAAVCTVEAPAGGFDRNGQPRILFEGHVFSRLTKGSYDKANPTISYPRWTRAHYATGASPDDRNAGEHARLQQAATLNREAALMSASWGRFQILGQNYREAGHPSLQSFINAMYASEADQLDAFVEYIKSRKLTVHLVNHDWHAFAEAYNGPEQEKNGYALKLAAAFERGFA